MLLDSLFGELKNIMLSLEIKYKYLGEDSDTKESRYAADRYTSCIEETDSFYSHTTYSVDAIKNSGMTLDDALAAEYGLNPTTIPDVYRHAVLREQRKIIISEYRDVNNYFRMLSGMPNVDAEGHYTTMEFYENFKVDFKPVHEFTRIEVLQLRGSGYLAEMVSMFPDAKYLNFLGDKGISPYVARKASNFQVLRSSYTTDMQLLDKFLTLYDQNREYVMSVLYVKDFSKTKPYYDNYMAMVVLVMTIQRILADMFKSAIARDFYDVSMVKLLCDCYNVPFIEGLPLDYQKLIAKNLNKLLYYKSTDRVLFDIADILGFDNSNIYKYYLVKNHRMDVNGKPIFRYIKDEHGNMVEDKEAMYDVYFQTINILENNEEFALSDNSNKLSYNSVVVEDPYWFQEDAELLETIYNSEFNYIETKYLHMNIMFKLTEMLFEIVHIHRMLQDKRIQTEKLEINLPRIISNHKINLFTYTIFMCATIAKRSHLTGEIITSPSKTLYLMGFDFGTDLTVIKKALEENMEYVESNKIAEFIYYTDAINNEELDKLFSNIRGLWEFLSKCLKDARTIESYKAYERIYRALYVTQDMSSVLRKPNGDMPTTYLDLLESLDPELAHIVESADDDKLFDFLNHGIDSIKGIISNTKYLQGLTDSTDVLSTALHKMVRFFKSYTVDLREFNVVYVLDHPYLNALKIIDKLKSIEADITLGDSHIRDLLMEFVTVSSKMRKDERINLQHIMSTDVNFQFRDTLISILKISIISNITIKEPVALLDSLELISKLSKDDAIVMNEVMSYMLTLNGKDEIFEKIVSYTETIMNTNTKILVYDVLDSLSELMEKNELSFKDTVDYIMVTYLVDKVFGSDTHTINNSMQANDRSLVLMDVLDAISNINKNDGINLNDTTDITYEMGNRVSLKLVERYMIDNMTSLMDKLNIIDYCKFITSIKSAINVTFEDNVESVISASAVKDNIKMMNELLSQIATSASLRYSLIDVVSVDVDKTGKCEVIIRDEFSINRELSE